MDGIITQPKSLSRPISTQMKTKFSDEDTQDGSASKSSKSRSLTAHDWECYKQKNFFDDGTMTFFWRAHTFFTLFGLTCVLVYVAMFESPLFDPEYNAKRGLIAVLLVFLLLGVTQIPDAAFLRPHPALWRFVFCLTIVYELSLIFILFQTPNDGRKMLQYLDKDLGKPLAEKDYGGNCKIYDPDQKGDPFHNVKMLMFRDWWLCMVISIMFEILEYTLEHQLPNFSECWWDHWILDAMICNGLGIYLGMITLNYLSMKPYHWRGLWDIPTYRGKLKRILSQFGPRNWIEFDWKPTVTLSRWLSVLSIIAVMLLAELNTFYLKFVLWLQPSHFLNCARLLLLVPGGAVAIREVFQYLDDPDCKELGRQAFVILAIVITEFLIIAKFDYATITKPIPTHVTYFWLIGFLMLLLWTIWTFFIRPAPLKTQSPDVLSPVYNLQRTMYHYECVEQTGNLNPDKEQGIKKDVRQRIQRIQKTIS